MCIVKKHYISKLDKLVQWFIFAASQLQNPRFNSKLGFLPMQGFVYAYQLCGFLQVFQ